MIKQFAALALGTMLIAQPIDPALEQSVSADERIIQGESVVIDAGHVDMGAILHEGTVHLLVRDDTGTHTDGEPVWRDLNDVTFAVGDAAKLTVPEDSNYDFLGAKPGDPVWVIPQTEVADVPWLGWNTQSPTLADAGVTGVTLELIEHRGPGTHSLFLQPGGFHEPDLLWTDKKPEPIWAPVNTHTHANWSFSEPGNHLLMIQASLEVDGQTLTAQAPLKIAVATDPATYEIPAPNPNSANPDIPLWLMALIGAIIAALILGIVITLGRRKKQR